jgi:oxygen-dependent protoporphyrinogen oxidase
MKIAIIGGGISGLTAAYELELARKRGADIDWALYEASDRLGGTIETTTHEGFILEGGPDGWITEKPCARDLAIELGPESDHIYSNDATRKTYIFIRGVLQPIPDRMRLMVPEDLSTLEGSPLFSDTARAAYAAELTRAAELKASAPAEDESVASFVRRHFGEEVLSTLAAPLLSGVFGGDVETLSVRAVMPAFVAMEREHGSLIAALQSKAKSEAPTPIFTSLRNGVASLTSTLVAKLPNDRLRLKQSALSIKREGKLWCLRYSTPTAKGKPGKSKRHFNHIIVATPADVTRGLLQPLNAEASKLLATHSSSAVLVAFAWPAEVAVTFNIPPGFGFLVPQSAATDEPQLLAATFVDQKFPHRAPENARIIRTFFGGNSHEAFAGKSLNEITDIAHAQLQKILGPLPRPVITNIRQWPRSLPQYEVGHIERVAELDAHIANLGNLTLLGNAYRGVGLPDLIRDARAAARNLIPKP